MHYPHIFGENLAFQLIDRGYYLDQLKIIHR